MLDHETANPSKSLRTRRDSNPRLLPPETKSAIASFPRFPRFRDFGECAVARESVRFCALTGLVIPPRIIQLAWASLADAAATDREVALARWVLLSTLREGREG